MVLEYAGVTQRRAVEGYPLKPLISDLLMAPLRYTHRELIREGIVLPLSFDYSIAYDEQQETDSILRDIETNHRFREKCKEMDSINKTPHLFNILQKEVFKSSELRNEQLIDEIGHRLCQHVTEKSIAVSEAKKWFAEITGINYQIWLVPRAYEMAQSRLIIPTLVGCLAEKYLSSLDAQSAIILWEKAVANNNFEECSKWMQVGYSLELVCLSKKQKLTKYLESPSVYDLARKSFRIALQEGTPIQKLDGLQSLVAVLLVNDTDKSRKKLKELLYRPKVAKIARQDEFLHALCCV